jgi:hypothetical protein
MKLAGNYISDKRQWNHRKDTLIRDNGITERCISVLQFSWIICQISHNTWVVTYKKRLLTFGGMMLNLPLFASTTAQRLQGTGNNHVPAVICYTPNYNTNFKIRMYTTKKTSRPIATLKQLNYNTYFKRPNNSS